MSAMGMTCTVLATGLSEAATKDGHLGGGVFDIAGGKFGPNVSAWLREVASELTARSPNAPPTPEATADAH